MKIALLAPPLGCITQPYLSLPSLTGYLRPLGHEVFQFDAGMRVIDKMFTITYFRELQEHIREKISHFPQSRNMTPSQKEHFQYLQIADLSATDVIRNIEQAKAILRSKDLFYQPDKYFFAANIIHRGFDIASAAFYPTMLNYKDTLYEEALTIDNIYALTSDEARNPFLKIMREVVLPEISPEYPPVVGVSITYLSQLVAGYTLARLIKSASPETHIVLGGQIITAAEKHIRAHPKPFEWADSYVFGEGETALAKLLKIIESGFSVPNNFNRLYLKPDLSSKLSSNFSDESGCERENFDDLPTPDYSGLNLADFFSPETVFLISNGRGCYYGKCKFCAVSSSYKSNFQQRSLGTLRRDLQTLRNKFNARLFFFSDDCVPPKRCREIADLSLEPDSQFFWETEIRFEKEFTKETLDHMYRGGCRQVIIGNESGNQRILDLMKKGTNVETNREIIRNAAEAGIALNLHNFVGFPSETAEEARDTINLLVSLRDYITSFTMNEFALQEFSPIHRNPDAFGVTDMRFGDDAELFPYITFSTDSGATREEVGKIAKSAWKMLNRVYPRQSFFLDHVYGAHVFLLITHHNQRKIEKIFSAYPHVDNMPNRKPRLNPSIKSRQLQDGSTIIFNTENGMLAVVDAVSSRWLSFLDGDMSLKESAVMLYKAASQSTEFDTLEKATAIVFFMADDLYQTGFLKFG